MLKVCLFLIAAFCFVGQVSAQCGVYFKETSRQVLSNPIVDSYIDDFDGDGLKDIFGFNLSGLNSYQIYYYQRTGTTSFDTTARTSTIANINTYSWTIGDVNNDGKKDLIVTQSNTNPQTLTTYLNNGTGRFLTTTPAVSLNNGEVVWSAGDLNNDGKSDAITFIYDQPGNSSTVYYRLAQSDNSFGIATTITSFTGNIANYIFSSKVIIDDFNNDGTKDIALYVSTLSNTNFKVLTNSGGLSLAETFTKTYVNSEVKSLKPVDLNNDGKKDFVTNGFNSGNNVFKFNVFANGGSNTFTESSITLPSSVNQVSYPGDFDGDGDTDLIFPAAKKYILVKNQGGFSFSSQEFKSFLSLDSIESLNGDGKFDGLSLNHPFIDGLYRLTNPNASFSVNNAVRFRENVCDPIGQTSMVDFDGDGTLDRAFWNPSNGIWRYYTDDTQNNQVYFQWGSGALNDVPVPNDYDGDGQTDYAVYRKSNGTWWVHRSSDQQIFVINFGLAEDKPVPADYDGDGKADIAVFRPSDGNWHFWLSQSNQYQAVHFGATEDKPIPSDYDGDGKADICVFRPSTGVWYRYNSADNSIFIYQYGLSGDKPVPADFDGDGKSNIAVYRDGTWYVLKNDFSTSVFYWGLNNDVPFFSRNVNEGAFVYRQSDSKIYQTQYPETFSTTTYLTGSLPSEILVSSILPID